MCVGAVEATGERRENSGKGQSRGATTQKERRPSGAGKEKHQGAHEEEMPCRNRGTQDRRLGKRGIKRRLLAGAQGKAAARVCPSKREGPGPRAPRRTQSNVCWVARANIYSS